MDSHVGIVEPGFRLLRNGRSGSIRSVNSSAEHATDEQIKMSVEQILRDAWGVAVVVGERQTLREDKCFRFLLHETSHGLPDSVIVKKARREAGNLIDPDSEIPNPSHRLLDEWASLAFLGQIDPSGRLAPMLYGGNRSACLIAYEDWGPAGSLSDTLMGDDPEAARRALRLHAKATAHLHNTTASREQEYKGIRDSLGPRVAAREGQGWGSLEALQQELVTGFSVAGISPEPDFWAEFDVLKHAISHNGPFRAFVHNDSCPDNTWLGKDALRLLDFERSGYHHRLLDAVFARMSMPHCYLANAVPHEVVLEVEGAYRKAAGTACPALADNRLFGQEIVHACFYWVVSNGTWLLERCFQDDFTWGISTWRQRVLHRLDVLAFTCDEFAYMPAVGKSARRTTQRLREVWPTSAMPVFPAFH